MVALGVHAGSYGHRKMGRGPTLGLLTWPLAAVAHAISRQRQVRCRLALGGADVAGKGLGGSEAAGGGQAVLRSLIIRPERRRARQG